MKNSIITNYSANIDGIAVKRKPLANTKRGSQKGGGGKRANGTPCHIQHSPNTPTTGLRECGNDTSKSTGRTGRLEFSDPTHHAKGRTGDRPGPRKEATTRRNVTQGGGNKTVPLQTSQQTSIGLQRPFGNLHGLIWVKYNSK